MTPSDINNFPVIPYSILQFKRLADCVTRTEFHKDF